jgi:thioredoxin-related protein
MKRLLFFFLCISVITVTSAQNGSVTIKIHLRGVYDSKISVLGMNNTRLFKPIVEIPAIRDGQTATLTVPGEHLPGEFVLRFDYKENESSTPYPSEKNVIINRQDLEIWVRPQYCNNGDSTWYMEGEIENTRFIAFSLENAKKKEKLGLLQNFLMNYDDTESEVFKVGSKEYEQRRTAYNEWLAQQTESDKNLFISSMYPYQYVPKIPFKGSESDRINAMIEHYFDGMDFKNPQLIRTSYIFKWMDSYVNLYGQMATTTALRDSLFPLAGKRAIDKARQGDPMVYGWMVDYFYRGYESNAIEAGMKILQPYLDDPNCMTTKRQEIKRRLEGMQTLVPGSMAPDVTMKDLDNQEFDLFKAPFDTKYILLVFWSGGCSHCVETCDQVYPWQQQAEISKQVSVVAISLDETDTEIEAWKKKWPAYGSWKHLRAEEGIRSKQASDYYVLATPVMALIERSSKKIIAMPNTLNELKAALK